MSLAQCWRVTVREAPLATLDRFNAEPSGSYDKSHMVPQGSGKCLLRRAPVASIANGLCLVCVRLVLLLLLLWSWLWSWLMLLSLLMLPLLLRFLFTSPVALMVISLPLFPASLCCDFCSLVLACLSMSSWTPRRKCELCRK